MSTATIVISTRLQRAGPLYSILNSTLVWFFYCLVPNKYKNKNMQTGRVEINNIFCSVIMSLKYLLKEVTIGLG